MALEILNTDIRANRILILHPDAKFAEEIEAHFEQNGEFSGIHVYTASTIEEGRGIARKYGIQLAIFPQFLGERDFVSIQQELRNAQPSVEMIPLLSSPSITQLRESRGIGGVVDFGDAEDLSTREGLRNIIFGYLREKNKGSQSSKRAFDFVEPIQRALLVEHQSWAKIKELSRSLINPIVAAYDFSPDEAISLLAAEMIYMPWLHREQYQELLGTDPFHLGAILTTASSWVIPSQKPTSAGGLVITLANYIAEKIGQGLPISEVFLPITQSALRPDFLKHPTIRTVSEPVVQAISQIAIKTQGTKVDILKSAGSS